MIKLVTHLAAPLALALLLPTGASAHGPLTPAVPPMVMADGAAVLAAIDKRAAAFQDQTYDAEMAIFKGGKRKKTLAFNMIMKGLEKQLISFSAPGDVAGMKVLLQDADTLYVYMPEFMKVRRVAAHVQNQGFLGSTFTYEDMTQAKLSAHFTAELQGKKGAETTLLLTPKSGKSATYPKIEVVINGKKGGVTKLRYFDGSGNLVREQLREGWKKIDGKPMPTKVTMTNVKTGDKTVVTLSNIKVNQGVADSVFSRRMLLRD